MTNKFDINEIKEYFLSLQNDICQSLEMLDGHASFIKDLWERPQGGGGLTRVLDSGAVFEKAGVNFSHVFGHQLPPSATAARPQLAGQSFQAMGVSLVIHPNNPFVPTAHANVRFFTTEGDDPIWWFGGGFDLTPYYGFTEDCIHWHQTAYDACAPFGSQIYPQFKQACDKYFYLPHREEARGIGGLFYDDYNELGFEQTFALTRSIGDAFCKAYNPIVKKRMNYPYEEIHKTFQKFRRGRYVEFNLLYDRGTLFGIQSKGRTESILMSLPPEVNWGYQWQPEKNSKESKLYTDYLPAKDWLSLSKA